MYCPNCGIEIHLEGSYCAKCKKHVAYLTQKKLATFIPPTDQIDNNSILDNPPSPVDEPKDASEKTALEAFAEATGESPVETPMKITNTPKEIGYYCNFCGTFICPEDNYCYECGKQTRKQYYKSSPLDNRKKLMIGIGTAAVLLLLAVGYLLYS